MAVSQGRMLTAEQLVQYRTRTEKVVPTCGKKEFTPSHSWLEKKQVQSALDERKVLLQEERVERLCMLAEAEWDEDLVLARVTRRVGRHFEVLGHEENQTIFLYPEEALYLLENNHLELLFGGVSMSIQQAYSMLLSPKTDCTLEEYRVYSQLLRQGYRLLRHSVSLRSTRYEKQIRLDQYCRPQKQKKVKSDAQIKQEVVVKNEAVECLQVSDDEMECSLDEKRKQEVMKSPALKEEIVLCEVNNCSVVSESSKIASFTGIHCISQKKKIDVCSDVEEIQRSDEECKENVRCNIRSCEVMAETHEANESLLSGDSPRIKQEVDEVVCLDITEELHSPQESEKQIQNNQSKETHAFSKPLKVESVQVEADSIEISNHKEVQSKNADISKSDESGLLFPNSECILAEELQNPSIKFENGVAKEDETNVKLEVIDITDEDECSEMSNVESEIFSIIDDDSLVKSYVDAESQSSEVLTVMDDDSTMKTNVTGSEYVECVDVSDDECEPSKSEVGNTFLENNGDFNCTVQSNTTKEEVLDPQNGDTRVKNEHQSQGRDLDYISVTCLKKQEPSEDEVNKMNEAADNSEKLSVKSCIKQECHLVLSDCVVSDTNSETVSDKVKRSDLSPANLLKRKCFDGNQGNHVPVKMPASKSSVTDLPGNASTELSPDECIIKSEDGKKRLITSSKSENEKSKDVDIENELTKFYEEMQLIDLANEKVPSEDRKTILDSFPNASGQNVINCTVPASRLLPPNVCPNRSEYSIHMWRLRAPGIGANPHQRSHLAAQRSARSSSGRYFRGHHRPRYPRARFDARNMNPLGQEVWQGDLRNPMDLRHFLEMRNPLGIRNMMESWRNNGYSMDCQQQLQLPPFSVPDGGFPMVPPLYFPVMQQMQYWPQHARFLLDPSVGTWQSNNDFRDPRRHHGSEVPIITFGNVPEQPPMYPQQNINDECQRPREFSTAGCASYQKRYYSFNNKSRTELYNPRYSGSVPRFHGLVEESNIDQSPEVLIPQQATSWSDVKNLLTPLPAVPLEEPGEVTDEEENEEEEEVESLLSPSDCTDTGNILSKLQIIKSATFDLSAHASDAPVLYIRYDLYLPDTVLRKSNPSLPDFRLAIIGYEQPMPSPFKIAVLLHQYEDDVPLLLAIVLPDSVTFFRYSSISLPVYSSSPTQ